MSRALHPASSVRATHASATGTPARAARHAARVPASRACLKPSRRVGFASLGSRRDAREPPCRAASEDPDADVEAMVDVDAIRAMLESDPAVRAQEERIASEARNAASLQVDKQMAEASDAIRSELSRRGSAASDELAKTQEAALAELEAKSQAVLRAEAKMREIAAEREALEAEADGEKRKKKKWGASVGDDVDENAERVEAPRRRRAPRFSAPRYPRLCCSRSHRWVRYRRIPRRGVCRPRCSGWSTGTPCATISETISSKRACWARSA